MREILDKFKDRIVAITHKDIPPYDWQEAGYSNARAEAETDLKQEILGKLPEKKSLLDIVLEDDTWTGGYHDGFNDCLAQVRKIIEGELK